jgi:hypothetical protein
VQAIVFEIDVDLDLHLQQAEHRLEEGTDHGHRACDAVGELVGLGLARVGGIGRGVTHDWCSYSKGRSGYLLRRGRGGLLVRTQLDEGLDEGKDELAKI